jgi:hypothetical protein
MTYTIHLRNSRHRISNGGFIHVLIRCQDENREATVEERKGSGRF